MRRKLILQLLALWWLQPVPYIDTNFDNFIDRADRQAFMRIAEGGIYITVKPSYCWNIYHDKSTELVEVWTYQIWASEPVMFDGNPDVEGFNWVDPNGGQPIAQILEQFYYPLFPDPNWWVLDVNEIVHIE